ncbi:hypothetical protein LBMAG32_00400 [Nitrosomonadaceae bacterium]|nr:hypothetical protein LBMAG32_00400 [Nitrosomonadaceae bacterium]
MKYHNRIIFLLLLWTTLFVGCASVPHDNQKITPEDPSSNPLGAVDTVPIDPYENFNRKFYSFTDAVDNYFMAPITNTYIKYIPRPIQNSVGNFYSNLAYPNVILNDFLQGKLIQGFQDSLRFFMNSTVGLLGIFDVATSVGLKKHDEDFGQTLGAWGVDTKSYMFLPFLGPSSSRDIASIPMTIVSNALTYAGYIVGAPIFVPLGILAAVDKRAQVSDSLRIRDEAALDPYLFVREAYLQQRKHLVQDGNVSSGDYSDIDTSEVIASDDPEAAQPTEPCQRELVQQILLVDEIKQPSFLQNAEGNLQNTFSASNMIDCPPIKHEIEVNVPYISTQTNESRDKLEIDTQSDLATKNISNGN